MKSCGDGGELQVVLVHLDHPTQADPNCLAHRSAIRVHRRGAFASTAAGAGTSKQQYRQTCCCYLGLWVYCRYLKGCLVRVHRRTLSSRTDCSEVV